MVCCVERSIKLHYQIIMKRKPHVGIVVLKHLWLLAVLNEPTN